MPWDDDDDDDPLGQPPPPEDRLWRHPSEMASTGASGSLVLVTRPAAGKLWLVGLLGCMVGALGAVGILSAIGAFEAEPASTAVERIMAGEPPANGSSVLEIAAPALPAVVRVEARSPSGVVNGTGVVIRTDGYLLATSDCIDGAESITVWFSDGTSAAAVLVGRDRESDVAVLKAERGDLLAATLLDRPVQDALDFGDATVVIDAAPASGPTPALTEGFVSAISRRVDGDDGSRLFGMIQVSSRPRSTGQGTGRVLIDAHGTVVGLISARRQVPAGQGGTDDSGLALQFAVPIDHARNVAEQILTTGRATQPMLGVTGVDLDGAAAERYGVVSGLQVETVEPDSPAARAGIRPGDVVVGLDGQAVGGLNDLVVALRQHRPGDTVAITFVRRGDQDVALAQLAEKPKLP